MSYRVENCESNKNPRINRRKIGRTCKLACTYWLHSDRKPARCSAMVAASTAPRSATTATIHTTPRDSPKGAVSQRFEVPRRKVVLWRHYHASTSSIIREFDDTAAETANWATILLSPTKKESSGLSTKQWQLSEYTRLYPVLRVHWEPSTTAPRLHEPTDPILCRPSATIFVESAIPPDSTIRNPTATIRVESAIPSGPTICKPTANIRAGSAIPSGSVLYRPTATICFE